MNNIPKYIIEFIKEECEKSNISFIPSKEEFVEFNGIKSNGYFDHNIKILACSNNANSLYTLLHEYCHMQQWLEQCDAWVNHLKYGDFFDILDESKSIDSDKLTNMTLASYYLELDCEQRTTDLLKEFKLGNVTEYIQKSNAYTLFYFYVMKYKKWYKIGKEPYSLQNVWSKMPKTFNFNLVRWINKSEKLFHQCV